MSTTSFFNKSYLLTTLLWKYDMYGKEKKTPFDMGYQCTTQLTSGDLELSDTHIKRLLFTFCWLHSLCF